MLIIAYLFKIHCVYIFLAPRTNSGVLFVDWLAIKQFAFALSILAKEILAFHRHSLGIKDTVHLSLGQLSTFKSSNAYVYSFIGHGGGIQPLSIVIFYAFAGLRIGNAQVKQP